jgi:hypothetical protein
MFKFLRNIDNKNYKAKFGVIVTLLNIALFVSFFN